MSSAYPEGLKKFSIDGMARRKTFVERVSREVWGPGSGDEWYRVSEWARRGAIDSEA